MLSVHDLHHSYDASPALAGISFEVERGETLGLLGPNGAGKSTTIHILCGLLRPRSGSVSINGQMDPSRADVRRSLGFAPQSLAIYDELTADENLRFFGRMYGLAGAALSQRVAKSLQVAALTDRGSSRVSTYSGGMKRRLNLACAIIHDPQILMLDEPTVGVDPQSRNLLFDTLGIMKAEGRTLLYTTHYMEEAQRLCDRVAIIDAGRILDISPVADLIARHGGRSRVVATFDATPVIPDQLHAKLDGKTVRFESNDPVRDLACLQSPAAQLTALAINSPTLEDVFLNLTGRTLRDE
ncbi:MAG: ABC transporter ATP-binding protein [Candidatus Sumerlaeaceae bacterium]